MTDNITLKSIKASLHRERGGPGPNHGNDIGEDEHLDEWVTQDNKNMSESIGVIELYSSAWYLQSLLWSPITVLRMAGGSAKCQKQTLALLNLFLMRGKGSP